MVFVCLARRRTGLQAKYTSALLFSQSVWSYYMIRAGLRIARVLMEYRSVGYLISLSVCL